MNRKLFWKTVLPSMAAFMFTGVYAIVDGFFVGRNVGDAGLAAINLAYPLTAFIQACGSGIGMGGAIWVAISQGQQRDTDKKEYVGLTFLLLGGSTLLVTVFLYGFYPMLLKAFGASGVIYGYAADYMGVIAAGTLFQVFGTGLLPILRNFNGSMAAMGSMLAGFAANIVLDWLFVSVYQYGTKGAAIATVIGQICTCVIAVVYLIVKAGILRQIRFRMSLHKSFKILQAAVSAFGLTMVPNVVIILINKGALVYGGPSAVSCYAVISYAICVVELLVHGVGDGAQPLISRYFGEGDLMSMAQARSLAYKVSFIVAVISIAGLLALKKTIPIVFGVSPQTLELYQKVLPFFLIGLLPMAFLRISTSYFYAVAENRCAYLLIYGEPVLLTLSIAFFLPVLFGLPGVWLAVPLTQTVLTILGWFLLRKSNVRIL